jgi:glutathione S-transferase
LDLLGTGAGFGGDALKSARKAMEQNLAALSTLLSDQPYLIADYPTLADFAVAGLSMYVKFPAGPYLNIPESLKGKGVPGLADAAAYATFWQWRDRLYADYRKTVAGTESSPSGSSGPTSIDIE